MTDFETVYLFNDSINMMFTVAVNYTTLIFAFLVASVMAAERMSRGMIVVSLVTYVVISLIMIFQNSRLLVTWSNLALEIREMAKEPNSNVAWHALKGAPVEALTLSPHLLNLMYVIALLGSLYFFRECRRGRFGLPGS